MHQIYTVFVNSSYRINSCRILHVETEKKPRKSALRKQDKPSRFGFLYQNFDEQQQSQIQFTLLHIATVFTKYHHLQWEEINNKIVVVIVFDIQNFRVPKSSLVCFKMHEDEPFKKGFEPAKFQFFKLFCLLNLNNL